MTFRIIRAEQAAELDPIPLGTVHTNIDTDDLTVLYEGARRRGRAQGVADAALLVAAARSEREGAFEQAEAELASLALALAARIVGRALELEPATLADMVAHALTTVRGRHRLDIRVHPDDLKVLEARSAQLEAAAGGAVRFVADGRRARHSVCVDTEAGTLECDLATQIEVLAQRMGVDPP